jgi:hypothetical protein
LRSSITYPEYPDESSAPRDGHCRRRPRPSPELAGSGAEQARRRAAPRARADRTVHDQQGDVDLARRSARRPDDRLRSARRHLHDPGRRREGDPPYERLAPRRAAALEPGRETDRVHLRPERGGQRLHHGPGRQRPSARHPWRQSLDVHLARVDSGREVHRGLSFRGGLRDPEALALRRERRQRDPAHPRSGPDRLLGRGVRSHRTLRLLRRAPGALAVQRGDAADPARRVRSGRGNHDGAFDRVRRRHAPGAFARREVARIRQPRECRDRAQDPGDRDRRRAVARLSGPARQHRGGPGSRFPSRVLVHPGWAVRRGVLRGRDLADSGGWRRRDQDPVHGGRGDRGRSGSPVRVSDRGCADVHGSADSQSGAVARRTSGGVHRARPALRRGPA